MNKAPLSEREQVIRKELALIEKLKGIADGLDASVKVAAKVRNAARIAELRNQIAAAQEQIRKLQAES